MSKFKKAKSEQAFFKAGLYGATGSGKTFTALLWAEGLATKEQKKIAYLDTEHGTDFYAIKIPERTIHPDPFQFDVFHTRSIMEAAQALEEIDSSYGVVIVDSITHLWEAAKAAYTGKLMANAQIPIQAWGAIKKPYKRLITRFLDGPFHAIICGRERVVVDQSDDGELKVTGFAMKSEGETPYEPHILGRMNPERDKKGIHTIKVFFEKDRSGVLMGREFTWPNYNTILPIVSYLSGTKQGRIGSLEDATEKDVAAQEQEEDRAAQERQSLFETIRTAILAAKTVEELNAAWSLTKGKKTKLGDKYDNLVTAGALRKSELTGVPAINGS